MCKINETLDAQFPQAIRWTPNRFVAGFTNFTHDPAKLLTHGSWL